MAKIPVTLNWIANPTSPIYDSNHKDGQRGVIADGLATLSTMTENYLGAFKMPWGNYGKGIIAVNPATNTMFGDDNVNNDMPVYESSIPELVNSTDLDALNTGTVLQGVSSLRPKIPSKNWGNYETAQASEKSYLTGMYCDGEKLYFNAAMWYDTGATYNLETTAILNDVTDLANSTAKGSFTLSGDRYANKWLAPVPAEHQASLAGDMLVGSSQSRIAGAGTLSKGPSLFAFNKADLDSAADNATIPTSEKMSFRDGWLVDDYLNFGGASGGVNNDLYTVESQAQYGFIIPNTRTYAVFGHSAGFSPLPLDFTSPSGPYVDGSGSYPVDSADQNKSVGVPWAGTITDYAAKNGTLFYKNSDASWQTKHGGVVDGYSAYETGDSGYFYWFFDLDEINAAASPSDVLPYEYGRLTQPFERNNTTTGEKGGFITSGTYDPTTGILYLADPYIIPTNDGFEGQTVLLAYQVGVL